MPRSRQSAPISASGKHRTVVERDPGDRNDPRARVHPGRDVAGDDPPVPVRHDAALDASRRERLPGIRVRRKLHVGRDDVVARGPRESRATRLTPQLVFGRKAIFVRRGSDQARALLARGLDHRRTSERQSAAPRSRAFSTCAVMAVGDAARQGSGRGMVEVEQLPPHGELAGRARRARSRSSSAENLPVERLVVGHHALVAEALLGPAPAGRRGRALRPGPRSRRAPRRSRRESP